MSLLRFVLVSALAFLLFLVAGDSQPASAATFTVTKTVDTADGACDADCSLREAIIAANAQPGAATITLPAGTYTLSIVPGPWDAATGDLDITQDLTITGTAAATTIVDGGGLDRVFDIGQGGAHITVRISDITIRNGKTGGPGEGGGGIASYNAELVLINTVVSDNVAVGWSGGGIYSSSGTLALTDVTVSGNTSQGDGGGIYSDGPLTVTRGTVAGNSAGEGLGGGGGIAYVARAEGAAFSMSETSVVRNVSGTAGYPAPFGAGGGLMIRATTATISNSTIAANKGGDGGGLHLSALYGVGGVTTITNSTISGNAASDDGGGIDVYGGTLTITNSTIAGNAVGEGLSHWGKNIRVLRDATATLKNTVVATSDSSYSNCDSLAAPPNLMSAGHNLETGTDCHFTAPGDLQNTAPLLSPLASNGGPTQTHALLPGSPAIDAGDNADCPSADQRGAARPADGDGDGAAVCDIGAYEYEAAPAGTPTATATSTPPATPTPAASTWNQTCYIGAEQPIQQALADITADVQAVYRLNSSQTFDRWFPGRPKLSTITTVSPYQPLLILMSTGATWSQQPSGTPPSTVSLAQGWNSVCYAGQTESPGDATAGIAGAFSILYRLGSDHTWSRYVPDRPGVSNIAELTQYDAVLLLVTAEGGAQWVFSP